MRDIIGYISICEASCKWAVSEWRATQCCAAGLLPWLSRFGRARCISSDAKEPTDPRKKPREADEGDVL